MLYYLLKLIKLKLSIAVTITCLSGYILHNGSLNFDSLAAVISVFILASGMSALNQYQERERDAMMKRTRNRPVPAGKIKPSLALLLSIILIVPGIVYLFYISVLTGLLGFTALLIYNLLYTRLKPVTYLSIVPGALVGAIPPVIGWTAAGGLITDPIVLYIALLIFMWQIPHFWILVINYHDEYEAAGFKTPHLKLEEIQIKRIVYIWINLSSLFILTFPLFNIILNTYIAILIVFFILLFNLRFAFLIFRSDSIRSAFILSNAFIIFIYIGIAAGSLA